MQSNGKRVLALCGLITPLLFTILLIFASFLRPGYSQLSGMVSDLGVGTNAIIQNVNFVACGLLILGFAVGLHRELGRGQKTHLGPALVGGAGVMYSTAGIFPEAPCPYPCTLHGLSAAFFPVMIIGIFFVWLAQRQDRRWGRFASFSLVMSIVSFGVGLVPASLIPGMFGLFQRIILAALFLWVSVTAAKLYALS